MNNQPLPTILLSHADYLVKIGDHLYWNRVEGSCQDASGNKVSVSNFDPDTGEFFDEFDDFAGEFGLDDWVQCTNRESAYYGWKGLVQKIYWSGGFGCPGIEWILVSGISLPSDSVTLITDDSHKIKWEFLIGDFVFIRETNLAGNVIGYIPGVPAYKIMLAGGGYAEVEADKVYQEPYKF